MFHHQRHRFFFIMKVPTNWPLNIFKFAISSIILLLLITTFQIENGACFQTVSTKRATSTMPVWFDNGSRSTTTKSKKRRTNNYRLFRLKSMSECERAGLFPPGRSSSILFTVPPASSSFSTQQQQQNDAKTTKCTTEIESRKKKKGQAEQYS
mmetsp:Transcript_13240/g.16156  ORF Transcript_13240/g.16156 Transcript_13240/m.16156 type:complete len:153 (-) Transcript_13240:1191-1649(-)